jgi:hypothetical protein
MTGKPQFEHKNPRFSGLGAARGWENALHRRRAKSYNAPGAALEGRAKGNDVGSFGLMALLERGAAAGGSPGQTNIRQMGAPR